jgi:chromosome segregation ATPase
MEINLKKSNEKLKTAVEENKISLMKIESLQAKSKGDENEFMFKYEELKTELEQKFNDIKEEYIQIQNENDKRIALLEQENSFLQKENERCLKDLEYKEGEMNNLKIDLETSGYENETLKKEFNDLEIMKQKELFLLKNEFEKKMKEVKYLIISF